ncbi:MAG: AAA family ATPase [Lactococcus lactis]
MEIHVGTLSPLKKKAKDIYEAVEKSIPGDVIILHKSCVLSNRGIIIPHSLTFVGNDKSVSIGIAPGIVGFFATGTSQLEFSNLNIRVGGQANAIRLEKYSETIKFNNSSIVYQSKVPYRDRNPLLLTDNDSYEGKLEVENSAIQNCEVALGDIDIKDSKIGLLPHMGGNLRACRLYAQRLTVIDSEITYVSLVSVQEAAFLRNISSYGNLELNGKCVIETLDFRQLVLTDKEGKQVAKDIKKYPTAEEQVTNIFCLKLLNEQFDVTISDLTADGDNTRGAIKEAFLLIANDGVLHVNHAKIGAFNYQNVIDGLGEITYEDVVDDSNYNLVRKPSIKGFRTISPLLDSLEVEVEKNDEPSAALDELYNMIGLTDAKDKISRFAASEKMKNIQIKRGISTANRGIRNLIFAGPPGTGKTKVANNMAQILYDIGAIKRNIVVEVTPAKLKGTVVGESAKNLIEACEKAKGGILFIDEAYSLTTDDQYNKDMIDELLTWTDEKHSEDLIVILAGYKHEIEELIYETNPGLSRRFPTWINFQEYTNDELKAIALSMIKDNHALVAKNAFEKLFSVMDEKINQAKSLKNFGNASFVNTFVNQLIEERDVRLSTFTYHEDLSNENLLTITVEDINTVSSRM